MEWMATITGDHVGYPGFPDLEDFSPRRKILGSKNSHAFWHLFFSVMDTLCLEFRGSDDPVDSLFLLDHDWADIDRGPALVSILPTFLFLPHQRLIYTGKSFPLNRPGHRLVLILFVSNRPW